jgi:DmsE family decaheme c-type cytochrome
MKPVHVISLLLVIAALAALPAPAGRAADNKFKLKEGAKGKVCLGCHVKFQDILKKPFVHTPVKDGECTGCHSPHTSSHGHLLSADVNQICRTCHVDIPPQGAKSVHKPVADGDCVKCHDPHASDNKFNLKDKEAALCLGCHKDMADYTSKVKFKHKPVEEGGCTLCHDPHASLKNPYMLKDDVPGLCLSCHKAGTPAFARPHMNYPVEKARCTTCHNPHGSDKRGILYNDVHPPVANRMCNQCHEDPTSPEPFKTKKQGMEICKLCHGQKIAEIMDNNRVHWPVLDKQSCLTCHNPHASTQPSLLKADLITLCGSCHSDTIKRQQLSDTKHPPVTGGECTACHDPHSSNTVLLFNQPRTIDLCGQCHDWEKHSSHPIGAKFKDPRNRNLTMQCLSCHRAHGTEYKHMLPYATTTELCVKCHAQFKR